MAGDVSARELTQQVWDEVAAERALRPPPAAGLADGHERLLEDGERHYVNSRYVLRRTAQGDGVDGGGRTGSVKRRLRARAARFVVHVLGDYFDDEQEFLAHLVRLQNTVTVHIDRLSDEVRQLQSVLQAESGRLRAADIALHARLEDRVRTLEDEVADLRRQNGGAGR
jgi:hypothetical protein